MQAYSWDGGWWVNVLGVGFHAKDRRRNYRTYAERHGTRRLRLGDWVVRGLG